MPTLATPSVILALTVGSILLIVTDQRTAVETRLRQRFGIDRDWWIPVIAFGIAVGLSAVDMSAVRTAFAEKLDIIALIFSFSIMSEGLSASGFFRYLAYKIVALCEGNSTRLVLYMFTMTSAITFFTTNDIVVLVVTPIIVEVCYQAGIRNTKPILLSQFIAANTLSMGLLIGSPTNIIIAEELGIDFFDYLGLMLLPAFVAFVSSFLLITLIIRETELDSPRVFEDLYIQPDYSMPQEVPEPYFTAQMRNWILIFSTFVALVAIVTFLRASLFWCAVPATLIALGYWVRSDDHTSSAVGPLKRLPFGVFFFGMTFFIFAESFSDTAFFTATVVPAAEALVGTQPVVASLTGVIGSGLVVNVFNDLPAAALIAQLLSQLEFGSSVVRTIFVQASLAGLNIGTYLTQAGALAGLIWFNQLRLERQRQREKFPDHDQEIEFPRRFDLIRYGSAHFVFTGVSIGLFLIFGWVLFSILIGPY